jgi:hypothetical protein
MLKGKAGNHRPHEGSSRPKKSKPHQQAPPIVAHNRKREFDGNLTEQDAARSAAEKAPEQQTLVDAKAETPQMVRNGYLSAEFVKPHTERDKNDKAFVGIEISFPLLEEHRAAKVLPSRVIEVWDGLVELGVDNISVDNVPAQVVELALAPDAIEKATTLKLPFAEITNAQITVVEAKGDGKSKDVTRLKFRVKVEWDIETWRFAGKHFGHTLWVKMQTAQGNLLEKESEAA